MKQMAQAKCALGASHLQTFTTTSSASRSPSEEETHGSVDGALGHAYNTSSSIRRSSRVSLGSAYFIGGLSHTRCESGIDYRAESQLDAKTPALLPPLRASAVPSPFSSAPVPVAQQADGYRH